MEKNLIGDSTNMDVAGVKGEFMGGGGFGIWGVSAAGHGVHGDSTTNHGVHGDSISGRGVQGTSQTFFGVSGTSTDGVGVIGESATSVGVLGKSPRSFGVQGVSETNHGVHGDSISGRGVQGTSQTFFGVSGTSAGGVGVIGESASNVGVLGKSPRSFGVQGVSETNHGVHGDSTSGRGVVGTSQTFVGVSGESKSGAGVFGVSDRGIGVHGKGGRLAGFFEGDIEVTGDIRLTNADCAEDFDVLGVAKLEPGTVMVLGKEGALSESHQAYDKRVAGVISGAGDYKPGIILDKRQSQANRQPIALLGKVFCKVDAQFGPIEVGDLLTSSSTRGHAMRVTDPARAFGAVIGKALGTLQAGRGLVPVLVALR